MHNTIFTKPADISLMQSLVFFKPPFGSPPPLYRVATQILQKLLSTFKDFLRTFLKIFKDFFILQNSSKNEIQVICQHYNKPQILLFPLQILKSFI